MGTTGLPDRTLTATSAYGIGGYYDVPPGIYQVTGIAPAGSTCSTKPYIPGLGPNSALIKVEASTLSGMWLRCQ
jgi:hypothetical protein